MDNKSDEKFFIVQATIEAKRQEIYEKKMKTDEKLTNVTEELKFLTETITLVMDQTNISKFLPSQKDTLNTLESTDMVLANRRAPPLYKGNSKTIGEKKMKTDEKLTNVTEELKFLTETITLVMDQTNISKFLPSQKDTLNTLESTNMFLANRRAPPLDRGNSKTIGEMWTLKHDIRSPKIYELLIKTELKGDTSLDIKNLYNHIKMCLNAVDRL